MRLAAIGEDLLSIAVDQPFRFPATFTFVVRAFSVLDGIGKGLDPRFDISEIAKPYALELLRFREAGVEVVFKDFRKRWDRQAQAFSNIFRQPQRVEKIASMIQRLVSRPPHESSHNFPPKFHQTSVFHQIWISDIWHS
jgi:predicted unusual protein kinase regulating ubiquinone biosynthesis (AarF/ABC1/UbiB family)